MTETDYIAAEFDADAHAPITERESYELGQVEQRKPENAGRTVVWVLKHKYLKDEFYQVWYNAFVNGWLHARDDFNRYAAAPTGGDA